MSRQIYKRKNNSKQVRVDSDVHQKVKIQAANLGITIKQFVEDRLNNFFRRNENNEQKNK